MGDRQSMGSLNIVGHLWARVEIVGSLKSKQMLREN